MIDTNQKIKFTDVQVEGLKRSILHKQITDNEIAVRISEISFNKCSEMLLF
jgi:hypothetical protein